MISLAWVKTAKMAHHVLGEFWRFGGMGLMVRPPKADIGPCWTGKEFHFGLHAPEGMRSEFVL